MHQCRVEPVQWQLGTKLAVTIRSPWPIQRGPTASVCCPLSRLVRDFCIARYFEASQELDVARMIVLALISVHRFVLRRELSPFLHQIVARCSLVLKTGLLRHVRYVRRLTTGTDIEVRDLVSGDELGIADGPHELCSPERRLTLRIRIISADARS